MSARGRRPTGTTGCSSSASIPRSSPSSTTSTACARRRRCERSTTRSPPTTTTRSGTPSPTATGRRSTSSTRTASSATSTSAKDATSNQSASSSGCSASSASRPSKAGVEAQADWDPADPETYSAPARRATGVARRLRLNHWPWPASGRSARACRAREAGGSIGTASTRATRISCWRPARGPIAFRVLLDGEPPGPAHGVDVDEDGTGLLEDGRLYQLVRQHDAVRERTLQITFLEPGAEAYVFTFG